MDQYIHISYAASENCMNHESYGVICVHCNCCGRLDESTKREAQLAMYKRQLEEQYTFDGWIEGHEEQQKENIQSNIEYYKEKIKALEEALKGGGE